MVTPFLSIYLNHNLNISAAYIGFLMAMTTFVQFGGGIFGGVIAQKFGFKQSMIVSLIIRSIGFTLMTIALVEQNIVLIAMFLIAIGSAIYMPANKAYMVSSVTLNRKPFMISISNATFSAGMALGPLIAAMLIKSNPTFMFLLLGATFFFLAIIHQETIEPINTKFIEKIDNNYSMKKIFLLAWKPILFNVITFYIYFYFQNFMGLYTATVFNVHLFGWVMFLNFTLMFILQIALVNILIKTNYYNALICGFILMGLGIYILSFDSYTTILIGTTIMTIGEAILFLKGDIEIVSKLSEYPSIAFGIQRLCMGIGGATGSIIGGMVFAYYNQKNDLGMFWVIISIQCLIAILVCLVFLLRQKQNKII